MTLAGEYDDVSADEARRLLQAGARMLDVRTAEEYDQLGHVPGARLLPVDLIAAAPALLRDPDEPLIVCCEHGVRSRYAADVLARAGCTRVSNLVGGMAAWDGPREHGSGRIWGPSEWLLEVADLLPRRGGRLLDVASGRGRHALLMASAGFRVKAVDRDVAALDWLRSAAGRLELAVEVETLDLESTVPDLGEGAWDVLLVFDYLHRPLFPALVGALAPGGLLVYETFTTGQARHGRPTNPAFLLTPGELRERCCGLEVLRERETDDGTRAVAALAARKPGARVA